MSIGGVAKKEGIPLRHPCARHRPIGVEQEGAVDGNAKYIHIANLKSLVHFKSQCGRVVKAPH